MDPKDKKNPRAANKEAVARSIKRMASEAYARVDADKTAKPKTRLIGHARRGDCVGPSSHPADAIEDVETGERTPLGWSSVGTDHD
jgi:hypothetical protein